MGRLEKQLVLNRIVVVSHPIVRGMVHSEPERITPERIAELRRISACDPEHLSAEIELIETIRQRHPKLPKIACFDTAFHYAARGPAPAHSGVSMPRDSGAMGFMACRTPICWNNSPGWLVRRWLGAALFWRTWQRGEPDRRPRR